MDRETLESLFQGRNLAPATRRAYVAHVMQFFAHLRTHYVRPSEKRLTRAEIAGYLADLERRGRSPATVGAHAWAIKAYLAAVGSSYRMQDISLPRVGRREAPGGVTQTEARRILRDAERWGKRNAALISTLLYTGVRVSELVNLDVSDLRLTERGGGLRVVHGKGNKERYVPVPREARHYLRAYLDSRSRVAPGDPVFSTNRGTRIGARHVRHICTALGTHPHALRHTYARALASAGVDLAQIARLLGHASLASTAIYTIPTDLEISNTVSRVFGG